MTTSIALVVAASLIHASVPILTAGTPAAHVAASAAADLAADAGAAAGVGARPLAVPIRTPDPAGMIDRPASAAPRTVRLGPPARVVYHVRTDQKVVALTFDDGWSPGAGRTILATLVHFHVQATFFVNAMYVRWDPKLWRAIAAAGYPIGNHTYDHRDLTTLSYDQMLADMAKNASVFLQLTGYTMAPIFRPPYGARNRTVDAAVRAAGYPSEVLWNTVAGDTGARISDAQLLANSTSGGPGSIVLLHIGPAATPRILERVISSYRSRGFSFVTVPELLALRR